MRKFFCGIAVLGAVAASAAIFVASASAYGGGATHDTWQVGLSFNCDNPSSPMCQGPQGEPELGGFWGWVEFDRAGDQTWGDAQLTGCGHTTGGGGPTSDKPHVSPSHASKSAQPLRTELAPDK